MKYLRVSSRLKALFAIYFISAIDNCGYAMVFVLFPFLFLNPEYNFFPHNTGLTHKLITLGVLNAAFPIAQLIGAPIIGELADRFGRKRIFYLSLIGTIGAYFLTGSLIYTKSIILLFAARFLTGLFSGNQGLCNASIADLSPDPKQRARNYGILTVVWGLSFPIALILGGLLSDPTVSKAFSPSLPFYIMGFISLVSLINLAFFFPETYKKPPEKMKLNFSQGIQNIRQALRMPDTKPFFILMLIWTLGWGYSDTWYGAYSIKNFGVSQKMATMGFMIQGVGWTLGGAILKPILLKISGIRSIARLSYLITALLLIVAACMPTFSYFIFAFSLSAVMGAISLSSTFNLISISSPASMQGKTMGIAQSMMSLGLFLVPILGGISGAISVHTFYPISAFFLLIGLAILYQKNFGRNSSFFSK